jgi:hypothetical protein
MVEALKKAFFGLHHVEALVKFTNFTGAVKDFLNVASQTPGEVLTAMLSSLQSVSVACFLLLLV